LVLMFGMDSVVGQPAPSQPAVAPASSAEAVPTAGLKNFQARIDAAALTLRNSGPQFKKRSPKYFRGLAEFVSGNMLFVLLHELALASIAQLRLPPLSARPERPEAFSHDTRLASTWLVAFGIAASSAWAQEAVTAG
jgi:hypothetical protein